MDTLYHVIRRTCQVLSIAIVIGMLVVMTLVSLETRHPWGTAGIYCLLAIWAAVVAYRVTRK